MTEHRPHVSGEGIHGVHTIRRPVAVAVAARIHRDDVVTGPGQPTRCVLPGVSTLPSPVQQEHRAALIRSPLLADERYAVSTEKRQGPGDRFIHETAPEDLLPAAPVQTAAWNPLSRTDGGCARGCHNRTCVAM